MIQLSYPKMTNARGALRSVLCCPAVCAALRWPARLTGYFTVSIIPTASVCAGGTLSTRTALCKFGSADVDAAVREASAVMRTTAATVRYGTVGRRGEIFTRAYLSCVNRFEGLLKIKVCQKTIRMAAIAVLQKKATVAGEIMAESLRVEMRKLSPSALLTPSVILSNSSPIHYFCRVPQLVGFQLHTTTTCQRRELGPAFPVTRPRISLSYLTFTLRNHQGLQRQHFALACLAANLSPTRIYLFIGDTVY